MTTNLRKSFLPLALLLTGAFAVTLLTVSCGGPKEDGVWVPTPPDRTELGMRDHFIPKDSIAIYRKRYEAIRDTLMARDSSIFIPMAEAFNKRSMLELLKNKHCFGLRVYYGASSVSAKTGKQDIRLIVVGVDSLGNDILVRKGSPVAAQSGDDGDGGFEYGQCTPPCYGEGKP